MLSFFLTAGIYAVDLTAQTKQPPERTKSAAPVKGNAGKKTDRTQREPTVSAGKAPSVERTPVPFDPDADQKRFDAALAAPSNAEKARLLREFIAEFQDSEYLDEAREYLLSARQAMAAEEIRAGRSGEAASILELAVEEAPVSISNRVFSDTILKFPSALFYTDSRQAALEIARKIENKYAGNARHLLGLVFFYISIEKGSDASRLASAAIELEPDAAAGYQALGLASRLNFDLEEAARAFAKANEIDSRSVVIRRSLAEVKRALGRSDEAISLYRSILAENEGDLTAQSGLVLSLFDSGRRAEAEAELARALERDPRDFTLMAGVAYQYAAMGRGEKAIDYARRAIEIEPRYVWSHIALARGQMSLNDPNGAERTLMSARRYGNFPTLDYEIASARFKAGFFREAIEELDNSFELEDGLIRTRLGGRVSRAEKGFQELIGPERKASILVTAAADDAETSSKLKYLFEAAKRLADGKDDETTIKLVEKFIAGSDKMKLHRQLYAADMLLRKRAALPKVSEILRSSLTDVENGLDAPSAGSAVMASELYASRKDAFVKNEFVLIPEVPRQTLLSILRGRIEELSGWASLEQGDHATAMVRLRRAISVLPDKSAWWRSSRWRLAMAHEAAGSNEEALDIYIQTYKIDRPDAIRYGTIEALYRKVKGSIEGLEEQIGPNPLFATRIAPLSVDRRSAMDAEAEQNSSSSRSFDTNPEKTTKTSENTLDEGDRQLIKPEKDPAKVVDKMPVTALPRPSDDNPTAAEPTSKEPEKIGDEKAKDPLAEPSPIPDTKASTLSTQPLKQREKDEKFEAATVDSTVKPADASPTQVKVDAPPSSLVKDPELRNEVIARANTEKRNEPTEAAPEIHKPDAAPTKTPQIDQDKAERTYKDENSSAESQKLIERVTPANLLREPFPLNNSNAKDPEPDGNNDQARKEQPAGKSVRTPADKRDEEPIIVKVDPNQSIVSQPEAKKQDGVKLRSENGDNANDSRGSRSEGDPTGATRRRVVEGQEITGDQRCEIDISQQNVSILSNGGSLGVLVTVTGDLGLGEIKAASNSRRDIAVQAEPAIAGRPGQRYFIIRSISSATGMFQVSFDSPCGKREINVRVR